MESPRAVAFDTAAFQAADSFLDDPPTLVDPRAAHSFERVAGAFCNSCQLFYPIPGEENGIRPFLLRLWSDDARSIPEAGLTDEGFESIAQLLVPGFIAFVEGAAPDVARWIAFQFTDRIVDQYLSRASVDEIRQCAPLAASLLESNRLPELSKAISDLQAKNVLREPPEYSGWVGSLGDFISSRHLTIAYALSVYLRGPAYGWRLSEIAERPVYHHLWLRTSALRDTSLGDARVIESSETWFAWGTILRNAFDPTSPVLPRSPSAVETAMCAIREGQAVFEKEIELMARDTPLIHSIWGLGNGPRTAAEDLVVRSLCSAGIVPKYRQTGLEAKLLKLLRSIASFGGPSSKLAAESIAAMIPATWLHRKIRSLEGQARLRFARDTYWDVFDDSLKLRGVITRATRLEESGQ